MEVRWSMKKNNKGFSLVELIIVIAIMAILVGVIAPQLIKYIEKANVSADMQMLDAVYNAVVYASVDPDVVSDPDSQNILNDMGNPSSSNFPLQLEYLEDTTKYPAGNRFCQEVISTLGWDDLHSYEALLKSAHQPTAKIYFSYQGDFTNPIIMWITTTDATGKKDTSNAPTTYNESNVTVMEQIRSCIHIE